MLLALAFLSLAALGSAAQCPPQDSMFYLIPHEEDCSKFYICSHGIPVLQTCPDGTHFNPIFMVCQSPVFAGCDVNPPPSELPCPWPGNMLGKPHPHSCSKYYVCQYGEAIVFDCPAGLEYSEELQKCVWPHESNCNSQTQESSEPAQSVAQDDSSQQNDSSQQDVSSQQDGGDLQNGGCEEGALSSSHDCGKYNVCSHGGLVPMECPHGLHWNSELQFCDWPASAGCA